MTGLPVGCCQSHWSPSRARLVGDAQRVKLSDITDAVLEEIMPIAVKRRVEIAVVASGLNDGWSFWVTVPTYDYVSDETVASLARAQALTDLGNKGVAVSSLEVIYIEPLDD
jgi:hypothetical protein